MPHVKITSFQNPRLKEVQRLRESKARHSTGLTIVEGLREISLARKSKIQFKELFLCPDILKDSKIQALVKELESEGIVIWDVTKKIFQKISFGDRMEGLLAIIQPKIFPLEDLQLKKNPLVVVVEGLEKPGNLGAILRTCEAAGVDGLLVCDGQTDIYNPNVIRASLGTVFGVRVVQSTQKDALKFLKDSNIQICAATPQAATSYFQMNFKVPVAIVLGSEEKGLSDFWLNHADRKVKIPMRGKADSLNVSATAAIVVYEALRQRGSIERVA